MKSLRATLAPFIRKIIRRKKIKNYEIYKRMLEGKTGLEIGGPSDFFSTGYPLPIYRTVAVLDGCNFSSTTLWEGTIRSEIYQCEGSHGYGRQYIADATDLFFSEDSKYDFVLSCHSLEHIANPIKALKEWLRVLKSDGILVLVVPHKDGHFDTGRSITTLEHMLTDHSEDVREDDLHHVQEIVDSHNFKLDKRFKSSSELTDLLNKNYEHRMMHHHVFDPSTTIGLLNYLELQIISVDLVKPYNIVCLAQKLTGETHPDNTRFLYTNDSAADVDQFISC